MRVTPVPWKSAQTPDATFQSFTLAMDATCFSSECSGWAALGQPHPCGVFIEVEDVVRVRIEHVHPPCFKHACLLDATAEGDPFETAKQLTDRDRRQSNRLVGRMYAVDEVDDSGIGLGLLSRFADKVGVHPTRRSCIPLPLPLGESRGKGWFRCVQACENRARMVRAKTLFPLDRGGGLGADVVDDAIDASDLVDDSSRDLVQKIAPEIGPVRRHEVGRRHRP